MKDSYIRLRVSRNEYESWKDFASTEGTDMSKIIREAVNEHIYHRASDSPGVNLLGLCLEDRLQELEEKVDAGAGDYRSLRARFENLEQNYVDLYNTFSDIFNVIKGYDRDEDC
jgi:hypothetical protein